MIPQACYANCRVDDDHMTCGTISRKLNFSRTIFRASRMESGYLRRRSSLYNVRKLSAGMIGAK